MGLVDAIANRMRVPPGVERDDLVGAAMLALVREGPKFDPSRGVPEKTWVGNLARRRMLDEIRRQTGRMRDGKWLGGHHAATVSLDAVRDDDRATNLGCAFAAPALIDAEMVEERLAALRPKDREVLIGVKPEGMNEKTWSARRMSAKRQLVSGKMVRDREAKPGNDFCRMVQAKAKTCGLRESARQLNCTTAHLYNVIRGEKSLYLHTFRQFIEWLGISADDALKAMDRP